MTSLSSPRPQYKGKALRPQLRRQNYAADLLKLRHTLLGIVLATLGAGLLTLVAWKVMKSTSLPAFSTSMVTRALATVGIVGIVVLCAGLLGWWLMDEHRTAAEEKPRRARWRVALTYLVAYMAPAVLVIAAIGIPLSATRLWLDGIQVDQVFRTQFLTRTTEQGGYADMNYLDMPTYYPMGWFWLGGRLAAVLGIPGWEVFQPWALISLAVAGSILVPIWQHITGSLPVATAIAMVTTAVTLTVASDEPYSAIIAMGVPAVGILAGRACNGSWASTIGTMLFLGISASFYTLFTGVVALTVVCLIAVVTAVYYRVWRPFVHLAVIGIGSMAIAAVAWAPYLYAALTASAPLQSAAQHYLPAEGTLLPVPIFAPSVVGVLCFIGMIYGVMRLIDPDVRALVWTVVGIYIWAIASMLLTLAGTTLLGFRLEVLAVVLLATGGVLGLAELRLVGMHVLYPNRFDAVTNRNISWAFIVLLVAGGIYYAQDIPKVNEEAIDHAYSDTDGYGERADRFQSDSGQYYKEINEFIEAQGYTPNGTVVMTDEKLFMAYYPYHGFNAFTSHYANPLGEFTTRNEQMNVWAQESWSQTPQEFQAALDSAKWKAPDAIIFRGDLEAESTDTEGLKIHLAEDIFPNQPNVRYRAIFYNPKVFEQGWKLKQVGPFVVAVRTA